MAELREVDFQRVFQGAPSLFVVLEPHAPYTILEASDAYLAATRRKRSALVGQPLFEVFRGDTHESHGATVANLRASLERVAATRASDAMEVQKYDLPNPGGGFEERYWNPVNSPVLGDDGKILYIVHRVDDVTALARAKQEREREHALRVEANAQAEHNLRATEILDSIAEGFYSLDRDWRFTFVNRQAQGIVGAERGGLVGRVLWEVYPGLVGSEFECIYRGAMEQRQPGTLTAYYPDHDRWYEVHAYPAPNGVSIYFRNVTDEQTAAEERDRVVDDSDRQRRIYEAALSNTPDFVYVFDLQERFIYMNEALLTMYGKTREEAFGKTCLELGYEPWHAEMHGREIATVAATRKPIRGEVPFTGTNGRRIYDYIFVPVFGPQGDVVAVAGTTRDVTERQQAEQAIRDQAERLKESDRAKDEFLATLSHELRNPLAPLRNSLSLLRMAGNHDAKTAPIHEMMERQVNHLVRLVDDLLEMSRISRGTFALRKERVEISAVVRNAVETSQPLMQAAKHTLEVSLPDQPLWVEGDAVRLAQILSNLLDNAAKYTEDGGKISVTVTAETGSAGTVAIAIRDNGTGIAPDALPRMFEMFIRGDRTSARGQGGLGIGLALARRLADMHGGTLEAKSEGVGKGSEFTLRVPLAASQAPAASKAGEENAQLPRQRILVVDDNRDAGDSLAMILQFLGADVRIARDGPEALKTYDAYDPSVVLLDIGMPGMDGYEVARTIRAKYPQRHAAIVALTGWGQENDRRTARDAGFDHHLVKPAELATLQALLTSLESSATA